MVYADLHVHTTRSDGTLDPSAVTRAARDADVAAVAVTDHDRVLPDAPPMTVRDGVTVIAGIELRVDADDLRVDLLAYGVTPTPALLEITDKIQVNRRERAATIVDRVESHLDVTLDIDIHDGVGRPHVARAIDRHPGVEHTYQDAFDDLIAADGPCYVSRWLPSFETGVAVLREAAAVVSLAHPYRYRDVAAALALVESLDGIERYYPYDVAVDTDRLDTVIDAHDLVATGGSDAHGTVVGQAGLDESGFAPIATAIEEHSA